MSADNDLKAREKANLRLALILVTVALVFGLGFVARVVLQHGA